LTHAFDKGAGKFAVGHRLLTILGHETPAVLGQFVIYLKDMAFTRTGSEIAIECIKHAKQNELIASLRILEDNLRKSVIPSTPPNPVEEPAEEPTEEPTEEGNDENNEEEENKEETSARTCAAKMALDQWAWRPLSCTISYIDDVDIVQNEVLPNLLDDWDILKISTSAVRVFLRMIALTPSVFNGANFQRDFLNESLMDLVSTSLFPKVCQDAAILGLIPDGSRLVVRMIEIFHNKPEFEELTRIVLSEGNVVHPALHKMVKLAVQKGIKAVDLCVVSTIRETGLVQVLKSPGAWIIAELVKSDAKLKREVLSLIRKEKIDGAGIEAIKNPREYEGPKRKQPSRKRKDE
jgi:hypothetical protein